MSGGSATTAGTTFQEDVATWLACLILAESSAPAIVGLAGSVTLIDLTAETANPIDDLMCRTSEGGCVFFQCKTSLSFSENDATFCSVFDQFVEQFSTGCLDLGGSIRPLDPARDRLVLAVSQHAPSTIRNRLRNLLDRIRSSSSPGQLQDICAALSQEMRGDFDTLANAIRPRLSESLGHTPTDQELFEFLRLIYVLPLDLHRDGPDRRLADTLLRGVLQATPERSGDAWRQLLESVRQFSPSRAGGDLEHFRSLLQTSGLIPRPAMRAAAAINVLTSRSGVYAAHIETYSSIKFRGQHVRIVRSAVADIETSATTDVLIVGDAGSGKSGCLWAFSEKVRQRGADTVLLAVDQLQASTFGALDQELQLPDAKTLVGTLADWSGDGEAFLIIDALDAARTTHGLSFLCEIIEHVRTRAPRWKIVASIRIFDLRHSRDVQRLFRGSNDAVSRDSTIRDIRHVFVTTLTDAELEQLGTECPELSEARQAGTQELQELTRNPFNLRLLAELVENGVASDKLSRVRTQIGLLDLYWNERVLPLSNVGAVQKGLIGLAQEMVDKRSLTAESPSEPSDWMQELSSAGVLSIAVPLVPGGMQSICFAHNILFDYAVARLLLRELPDDVLQLLGDAERQDLFLAIRPSVVMAFQRLWYASDDRCHFWRRAVAFAANSGIRMFGRIIAGNVAASEFRQLDDAQFALAMFDGPDRGSITSLMSYMWQAAFAAQQQDPQRFQMWGDGSPPWAGLAELLLSRAPDDFAWTVRGFLFLILPKSGIEGAPALTEQQRAEVNRAARSLVDVFSSPRHADDAASIALEGVAWSIAADPLQSAATIRKCLAKDRVATRGCHELPALAKHIETLAEVDESLVTELIDAVNRAEADDGTTVQGGKILSLVFRNRDLLSMADYAIEKAYPRLLRKHARLGTTVMLQVLEAHARTHEGQSRDDLKQNLVQFESREVPYIRDYSYIWNAGGAAQSHQFWFKMATEFRSWLVSSEATEKQVAAAMRVYPDYAEHAVSWKQILVAAMDAPKTLGTWAAQLLACPPILYQSETRTVAATLLPVIYEHLSKELRESIERAILELPRHSSDEHSLEHVQRTSDMLIGMLPRDLVVTSEAITRLNSIEAEGGPPPNRPTFEMDAVRFISDSEYLRERGVKLDASQNAEFYKVFEKIKAFCRSEASTLQSVREFMPEFSMFKSLLGNAIHNGVDQQLLQGADEYIAACYVAISQCSDVVPGEPEYADARDQLLLAAKDSRPTPSPDQDENWDRPTAGWSSAPRVDAANGLLNLASRLETADDEVLSEIERLSGDPVHAVRQMIAGDLLSLWQIDQARFWKIAEHFSRHEQKIAVLRLFVSRVLLGIPRSSTQHVDELIVIIYERMLLHPLGAPVREECTFHFLRRALWDQDANATWRLDQMLADPISYRHELMRVVLSCRDLLTHCEESQSEDENKRVRNWGFTFLKRAFESLCPAFKKFTRKDSSLSEEEAEVARQLFHALEAIANQVDFASDQYDKAVDDPVGASALRAEKQRFLQEGRSLLEALCGASFSRIAYGVLKVLHRFRDIAPQQMFMLTGRVVASASSDGIHLESIAADRVVEIVEEYLAEYRGLFRTSPEMLQTLMDLLDQFVKAGWPRAVTLTYRLDEVFRG